MRWERENGPLITAPLGIAIRDARGSCLVLALALTAKSYLRSPDAEEWLANNTNRYLTRGNRTWNNMFSLSQRTGSPPIMTDERRKWAGKVARKLHFATFSASWFLWRCATHKCSTCTWLFPTFLTPLLRSQREKCRRTWRSYTRAYIMMTLIGRK